MANDALIQYIKAAKAQGFTDDSVRTVLLQNGWLAPDIDQAFAIISNPVPMPNAPIPEAVKPRAAAVAVEKSEYHEYNSPYSIGLGAVVGASLFVIVNKFIHDVQVGTGSINGKLILDALVILPFLAAAFMLHGSFSNDRKRYLILSQPYFAVSAYLLVRLLWDTSSYILNVNAAYGVYIVLVMVVLVLTGLIIFVRNYITR